MSRAPAVRFRWVAPDGRRGRWRKSIEGAVMSAAANRHSGKGLRVQFCAASAIALWPGLQEQGWALEKEGKPTR